jgi:hypothetical protein
MDTFLMVAESGKKSTVEQEKTKFVDFFMKKSLADWKNKDEGVILQQMHNAVANFGKVYPAYLFGPMNSRQKFRADDKTLPFAAEHKDIVLLTSLHKRLQLDKFTSVFKGGDERLQNIVREGMRRSAHVLVFLETLSAAHKTLLPKQVLYLLYRYCAVSVINEYIYVASSNYPLNVVSLKPSESTIQGVRPVRVDMSANKENEQLYQHLASLLHMFVHLEQDDNRQIDLDYAQIMFATTELKRAETKRILDNLGKMTPEQKESAMRRKQYRIGEYSGYSGKQLTGYSGAQWMKEANELTEYYDAVIESANIDELNNMNEHEDPSVPNDPDEYDGNDDND